MCSRYVASMFLMVSVLSFGPSVAGKEFLSVSFTPCTDLTQHFSVSQPLIYKRRLMGESISDCDCSASFCVRMILADIANT